MLRRFWADIHARVTIILIAIVVTVTAVHLGMSLLAMRDRLIETVRDDLDLVVDVAETLVSTNRALLKSDALIIAKQLVDVPDEELEATLTNIVTPERFMALTVLDRHGIVASHGEDALPPSALTLNENGYLQKAFEGNSTISTTYWNEETKKLLMYIYVPINETRVLSVTIPGMLFSELLSNFKVWKTGNLYVLDEHGIMIANPRDFMVLERYDFIERGKINPSDKNTGEFFETVVKEAKEGRGSGSGSYFYDGKVRLGVWQTVTRSTSGWIVAVGAPIDESPVRSAQLGLLISSGIFLICGIALVVFISREVAKPFKKLEVQNQDLMELNAEVAAANEAKSRFLANMSHEMRTPMNAIIGLSELLLGEDEVRGEVRESLDKVHGAGVTLLNIVNDILDISKIESGKFELVPVIYDLPSFINDTVTLNIMHIAEKPIVFKLSIDENLPSRVLGDDLRIKQVCNNLLSNAFKYTREGLVEWRVSSERDGENVWMTFVVKDTGIGIKPEDMEKLFSNYSQVDTKSNRKIRGTGLGLVLARRMIEMMDGQIMVESEYGKGSTFTARFRQKFVTDVPIGREVAESLMSLRYSENQRDSRAKLVRVRIPYAKVLVVDDVQTNLDVARGMMKSYGMQVDCVMSGRQAVDLIRKAEVRYNAIFMDHMMPEMDGIEAARIIREEIGTDYAKNIPIIAMTANAIAGNEAMFLSKGFQAFISKPIDIMLLDAAIRYWIRDKELEKELVNQQVEVEGQKLLDLRSGQERRDGDDRRANKAAESVSGLDTQSGVERFGGDEGIYNEVLASYAQNTPPLLEKLRAVTVSSLAEYAITVHGLKGVSRSICAEDIGARAEALEHAAKANDFAFVEANNAALLQATEALIAQIGDFLSGDQVSGIRDQGSGIKTERRV